MLIAKKSRLRILMQPQLRKPRFLWFPRSTYATIVPHYNFEGEQEWAESVSARPSEAPSTRIRIFLYPRLFLCGYGRSSTRIRCIRQTNPQLFESALQSGRIRYESGIVWTLNPAIIFYWRYKIESRACFAKVPVTVLGPVSRLFGTLYVLQGPSTG